MENNKENIKIIFKDLKNLDIEFVKGCIKYYKLNKKLSDNQFKALLEIKNKNKI